MHNFTPKGAEIDFFAPALSFFCKKKVNFWIEKKSLALVLYTKSRQFPKHEDKVNAHAGMPFFGVSRFAV